MNARMRHVLTLVGDPATRLLDATVLERARDALRAAGAEPGATDWLAPGLAVDLLFDGAKPKAVQAAVAKALAGQPFDLAAQDRQERRKRLFVADMDSTIVQSETLDELAGKAGLGEQISAITLRSMRGEVPFEESLRQRVAMLTGLSVELMGDVVRELHLMPGARSVVRTLRANGCYTALVSGGFTFATEPVAELCGFHEQRANLLLHSDGHLTGQVQEPILGRHGKLEALRELAKTLELTLEQTCAVGDGANDLAMIKEAGLGVAFRGKPLVRAEAPYAIDHGDLTTLLYFQGFREIEMV
jgi:phosphoserine phosphatase